MVAFQLRTINKAMHYQHSADAEGYSNQHHNRTYRG
jgi:hypothetical protein